jgi:hypothetical protein
MSHVRTTQSDEKSRVAWSTDLAILIPAAICPLVLWVCAVEGADMELTVTAGDRTRDVGAVAVALTGGLNALLAVSILRALERRTREAFRIWTLVCIAGFVVSLAGPMTATSWEAAATLVAMHAIVAAVIIGAGRRTRAAPRGGHPR